MLTRLHVQGYKALRNVDTTLEPLTVLVGPNGCGKTSVLESISLVRDIVAQRNAGRIRDPIEDLLTKNSEKSLEIEVDLRHGSGPFLTKNLRRFGSSSFTMKSDHRFRSTGKANRSFGTPMRFWITGRSTRVIICAPSGRWHST